MFKNNQPPRVGQARVPPTPRPLVPPLTPELLTEYRQVYHEAYVVLQYLTPEVLGRAIHQFLTETLMVDRFYTLFTGSVESVQRWEARLFDLENGINDAKLDFFYRLTARVLANWSGTDTQYEALIQRLALALSSEITPETQSTQTASLLPAAYVEKLADVATLSDVLRQNRTLVTIAAYVLYADHHALTEALYARFNPPAPASVKPQPVPPPSGLNHV